MNSSPSSPSAKMQGNKKAETAKFQRPNRVAEAEKGVTGESRVREVVHESEMSDGRVEQMKRKRGDGRIESKSRGT